ncbi:MAG TPA: glycosyltransferase family 2 protein [Acidothermaceae bacterium]|nr:glycosyltransferase family 2 protein [Acidothermaceae bacterium]
MSVVIPTLNEARNIPHVFAALPADVDEVIIVDGQSVDDTVAVARALRPDVRVVHQTRTGKGNALACGFAAAKSDIIVMMDADCSTDPREIPRFVGTLLHGADFAKGSRFASGGGSGDITRFRRWGNRALNGLVNFCYGTRYTDLCYGFNAFWRSCLPYLDLDAGASGSEPVWGDGFEIETLINIRMARAGVRIFEVPSYEQPRLHGASNLRAFSDGLRVLRTVTTERRAGRARAAAIDSTAYGRGNRGNVIHLDGPAHSHDNHPAKDEQVRDLEGVS